MIVWVTREEPSDGPLSSALRSARIEVVLEPVIEKRALTDAAKEIGRLGKDDWLVLTSPFAIRTVAADPARVPHVAVVGESSERAARARGFHVELLSAQRTAQSLFEALQKITQIGKVCYPRSSLIEAPKAWGEVEMISPVLYETVAREFDRSVIERVDVVSVASPSAARAVGKMDKPFASIGPSTTRALLEMGITPWVEAPERSFASLARAIARRGCHARGTD